MTLPPWRLRSYKSLPSTQDSCRARAVAGDVGRIAIRAEVQTSGRGSHGRAWESLPGNLSLSALLKPGSPASEVGQWALLGAVALAEALAEVLPPAVRPTLKWPNDVLLGSGKVAGILVEGSAKPGQDRINWLVIGFGVNLAVAPALADRATACVASYAPPPAPGRFAETLLARLDAWDAVRARDGFAAIRAAWGGHGPALGTELAIRMPGGTLAAGRFAGLGNDGGLLLAVAGGVRAFAVGEVEVSQP